MRSEGFCVNEKSTDTSWDRTSVKNLFPTSTEICLYILLRPEIAANCEKYAILINVLFGHNAEFAIVKFPGKYIHH